MCEASSDGCVQEPRFFVMAGHVCVTRSRQTFTPYSTPDPYDTAEDTSRRTSGLAPLKWSATAWWVIPEPEPYPPLSHSYFDRDVASTFLWKFKFSQWQIVYLCWELKEIISLFEVMFRINILICWEKDYNWINYMYIQCYNNLPFIIFHNSVVFMLRAQLMTTGDLNAQFDHRQLRDGTENWLSCIHGQLNYEI
jgi:hypothetical protein